MNKRYLNVAYEDRDLAKRLGAMWDPSVKKWYCRKGSQLDKVFSWRSGQKVKTTPKKTPVGQNVSLKPQFTDLPLFA